MKGGGEKFIGLVDFWKGAFLFRGKGKEN